MNDNIRQKANGYYLRKVFPGVGRKEIPLGKSKKIATTKAATFIRTFETSGFDSAMIELRGRKVLKPGDSPTFEEMESLYRDYCNQSGKPPREITIRANLDSLKRVFKRLNATSPAKITTVAQIDKNKLTALWKKDPKTQMTDTEQRTFATVIRTASSIFKSSALTYYATRGSKIENPFKGLVIVKPKVKQYVPMPSELRETIWNDCEKELPPESAMIVLMALGIGLRRSEIEAAIPAWFSVQSDNVLMHIKEEITFTPKSGEAGMVPLKLDLYNRLIKLRKLALSDGKKSPFFVPCESVKVGNGRIWERVKSVNAWLKSKGVIDPKPLHCLRKELGSHIAKKQGILEAAKVLRNTPLICQTHYAGIAEVSTVDMGGSFKKTDPLEELAKQFNMTVEEMKVKLAK